MKRCSVLGSPELPSVGVAFQAEHSSIPSSTYQPFTRTPLCSSTTLSGASERRHCQFLSSPLRPRGRAGVFRRREGPASQSFSRSSPSPCSSSLSSVRGFFSSRGWPPADPVGIRPPFVSAVSFRQRAHTIWTSSPCFGPSFVRVRSLRSSCVSCFYVWLRTGLRSGMAVFWAFAVVWAYLFVVVLYCLCGLARPLFCCSLLCCLPLLGGSDVFPGLG